MKIAIIINSKRITPELEKRLKSDEFTSKYNLTYDLFFPEPLDIIPLIQSIKSQSYNAYIIGGGDGTVRSAVEELADSDAVVGILPLGTFNLLATSLKYSSNIDELFFTIKNGKTKQIDLIAVNDRIAINHVWIGFYFYILKMRKKHQSIVGKNKLFKIAFNAINLFRLLPVYHLDLIVNNEKITYNTCLVYVANNEFDINLFDLNTRKSLSSGRMLVTVLNCQTRWQLIKCIISLLFNQEKNASSIAQFSTDELTIHAKSNLINLVIDGELFKLETPLHLVVYHKKLTVLVP